MRSQGVEGATEELPEFHLVVRRPRGRGPLAPYRFALAVAFALAIAGRELWWAAIGEAELDAALLRAGVAALFIWIRSGVVNGILASAERPTQPAGDES